MRYILAAGGWWPAVPEEEIVQKKPHTKVKFIKMSERWPSLCGGHAIFIAVSEFQYVLVARLGLAGCLYRRGRIT